MKKTAAKTNVFFKKEVQDLTVSETVWATVIITAITLAGTCGCAVALDAVDDALTKRRDAKRREKERIETLEEKVNDIMFVNDIK